MIIMYSLSFSGAANLKGILKQTTHDFIVEEISFRGRSFFLDKGCYATTFLGRLVKGLM
jgi:tRNA(Glu) U13 pseudouridine synthase TruD